MKPLSNKAANTILKSQLETPIGVMFICTTVNGVCLLEFEDTKGLEAEFKDLRTLLNATIVTGENKYTKQAKKELMEYFKGQRKVFDVVFDIAGTEFQKEVWEGLQQIPYGKTRSYQEQSQYLNKPKAIRAVASANGRNKIAIMIPCHRVIGKNGSLTGYAGGLERKRWLLTHELKFEPDNSRLF